MRQSTIILDPHIPLGGFLGMMGATRPKAAITLSAVRRHSRRGMGDAVSDVIADSNNPAYYPAPSTVPVYSPTWTDDLWNMLTGNLSSNEQNQLAAEESAELQQAGMAPAAAQAQATSDVTDSLATYSGAGAFGITTTGALPTSGVTGTIGSLFGGIPTWALVGLCGVGILLVVKKIL